MTADRLLDLLADEMTYCDTLRDTGREHTLQYREGLERVGKFAVAYSEASGNSDFPSIFRFARSRQLVNLTVR